MNEQKSIKPIDEAVELLPSFTDAVRSLEYLACSGLLKNPKVFKIKINLLSIHEICTIINVMAGKNVYIALFDDPTFKNLDEGLDMIKPIQDVSWA